MRWLYTITIVLGAALLFFVQPLVGRLLLPLLGGSPMVWNTCMVFFQVALLAGYLYAHLLSRLPSARGQAIVHAALVVAAGLALPIGLREGVVPPTDGAPVLWLLGALVLTVGAPLFVVTTSAPLLQRWFSRTGHRLARDPYFLYAASNAGSLAALLAYPLLVEPLLPISLQSTAWSWGYVGFAAMTIACGAVLWRRRLVPSHPPDAGAHAGGAPYRRLAWWALLAFVPSSLMLGATQRITTDVAAIPLFWIVPLALYLLTFVLAFGRRPLLPSRAWTVPLVILTLAVLSTGIVSQLTPISLTLGLNLALLFVAARMCHGRLAESRPDARHLTAFYLAIAVGGALGGVFNALAAPLFFDDIIEYPLVIALAFVLRPRRARRQAKAGGLTRRPPGRLPVPGGGAVGLLLDMTVLMLVAAEILAGRSQYAGGGRDLHRERTFFGVHRVWEVTSGDWVRYDHGTTCHGMQSRLEPKRPLSYYHEGSGIARLFAALDGDDRLDRVGVVGLGTGTLAVFAPPGSRWTFFEIDPAVTGIARNPAFFTFLRDAEGEIDVVHGDGRLSLARVEAGSFGLIVLDAFSSDAVPMHLLTVEAMETYFTGLRRDGIIAINVSNRHVDFRPALAALALRGGWTLLEYDDRSAGAVRAGSRLDGLLPGTFDAEWLFVARAPAAFAALSADPAWQQVTEPTDGPLWTDDFSNLLGSLRWW